MHGSINTHITHIEDDIVINGVRGAESAIGVLEDICDLNVSNLDISLKWDGAPAIFAGLDPRDHQFFVATKGLFSKIPKIYKSIQSIKSSVKSKELQEKLSTAYTKLSKIDLEGIYQGDLLYTEDLRVELIKGVSNYIFQPNTLVYAIECDSNTGRLISSSDLGIAWHTKYSGSYIRTLHTVAYKPPKMPEQCIYVPEIYNLPSSAIIKNKDNIKKSLASARKALESIAIYRVKAFVEMQKDLKSICYTASYEAYVNNSVSCDSNYVISTSGYGKWLNCKLKPRCQSFKSANARLKCNALYHVVQKSVRSETFSAIVTFQLHMTTAKELIIKELNKYTKDISLKPYKRRGSSLVRTAHEGYVVHDRARKSTYKLVDRSEFSNINFNNVKAWDHDSSKKIVIVYGRFNPPTAGHEKLINCAANLAKNCAFRIYISHTCDSKRNPLTAELKRVYMKNMFKQHAQDIYICDKKKMPTILSIMTAVYNEGYRVITLVVGSDRYEDMSDIVNKFNGKYNDHGYYNFDSIRIAIGGMRDEKDSGIGGISASKARECVMRRDYIGFKECMPKDYKLAKDLYSDLCKYLK